MPSAHETEVEVRTSKRGEPTWEMADFFPQQGGWSEAEYLALETNKLVEFNNGFLEFLPMPNTLHQVMAVLLCNLLQNAICERGLAVVAPVRMKIPGHKKYREPDVMMLLYENSQKMGLNVWTGADLVVEIVSPGGEVRDTIEKRADYAAAQIPEYWIVDPPTETILVLQLQGDNYIEHGKFNAGQRLSSRLLPDLELELSKLFNAGPKHLRNNA